MGDFQLRVDPGALRATASEVTGLTRALGDNFDELLNCVRRTGRYWAGAAGDAYRREFEAEKEETSALLALLGNYPADLLAMAGLYDGTERENTQSAAALPSDIL